MFNRKDDIRTFIAIMVVCIICVVLGLILSHKSNYDKLVYVDEYNVYFTNVNYLNNFISKIARKDKVSVYDILDKSFVDKNNINVDNVLEYFDYYSIQSSVDVDSMYFVQVKDNFIYYIEGKIFENGYDSVKKLIDDSFCVILSIDNKNKSYSLYPVDVDYENVINSIKKVNVINNTNNDIVKSELINKEQVCSIYLSDFTNTMFYSFEDAYYLLSDDMKKIYTSSSDYEKYIKKNFKLISTVADKCRLEEIDEKRVYTVIDSNDNTYVFTENNIMSYMVDFYLKEVSS